jgi:transcriptional regulator with XRE-family HTH domain
MKTDLAAYFKKVRGLLGMTQEQFAVHLKMPKGGSQLARRRARNALAKYETGKAMPPAAVLLRVQKAETDFLTNALNEIKKGTGKTTRQSGRGRVL